ncbi:polysaccharide deacetylase family protein [Micromonospora sagamiensis]|uniref:Polysaccharide deacetylase n=1 Tax=Micromonospora sagamiensis TaxID=47875 RepID=A0A562W9U4_9ACTN|nr:polysaccharide deacetylase family protein [Micromonospora sagamiensis]TWJ26878.1 polysaccharide deacetylase [Micromonospora sagamiensis]BCL14233.1 hydrolase [Micromonospora sagamiensis]
MPAVSPPRTLGIVVLVVAALLGSAYALGRSLIGPVAAPGVTAPSDQPHVADQPPATSVPPQRTPGPTVPADEPPPDGTDEGGPYGTRATTGTGQVALTFDDGPDPDYTPQALAALRAYGVTATFCLVGENARAHPDLVRAIAAEGHTLCNHSWNHDVLLGSRSYQSIQADLLRTNEAIRAAVPGARIAYFRQPGGAWTYPVVSVARNLGMVSLHWTVDPTDWRKPGAASIADTVTAGTVPGSIVLLHDAGGDRQGTVDALYRILPNLTSRFQVTALPPDL